LNSSNSLVYKGTRNAHFLCIYYFVPNKLPLQLYSKNIYTSNQINPTMYWTIVFGLLRNLHTQKTFLGAQEAAIRILLILMHYNQWTTMEDRMEQIDILRYTYKYVYKSKWVVD